MAKSFGRGSKQSRISARRRVLKRDSLRTRKSVKLKLDPQRVFHFRLPIPNHQKRGEEERDGAEQGVGLQLHPHKKPFFLPSPSSAATASSEYAPPAPAQRQRQQSYSRLSGMRSAAGGEIVEVQGGHIVRSIGRKDRHSKVCTAKGPRDRRVRLSAHTAIQFYDVQDRLGYDRPSKAVDWLIKNAKAAIDELAELPAWHPSSVGGISSKKPMPEPEPEPEPAATASAAAFSFGGGNIASSSFLPPSLDSDTIADTIKSFFPVTSAAAVHDSSNKSHHFQDLRLSLQSIQDPTFDHPSPIQHHHFSFDATSSSGFADQNQRMVSWNAAAGGGEGGAGGYAFNLPPVFIGQGQLSTQRGPLQSSNTALLRPWMEPAIDHQMQQALIPEVSTVGFVSGGRSFSGFCFPAGIHSEEVLDDISDKPSSGSSASHY